MSKVRVCIVDDSLTMRAMLGQMLDGERGIDVVGVVADSAETYAFIKSVRPEVVTMDVTHARGAGLALLERIVAERALPVIVLSTDPEDSPMVDEALRRGAVACFNKRELTTNTAGLVRLVKKAAALRPQMAAEALTRQRAAVPTDLPSLRFGRMQQAA